MRVRWWRGLGNREGIRHTSLVLRRCGTPYFARRVSLCDATVCPKLATNRTRDRRIQSRARHKPIFMSDRFRVLERASAARIHRSCLDAEHRADILYGNARCALAEIVEPRDEHRVAVAFVVERRAVPSGSVSLSASTSRRSSSNEASSASTTFTHFEPAWCEASAGRSDAEHAGAVHRLRQRFPHADFLRNLHTASRLHHRFNQRHLSRTRMGAVRTGSSRSTQADRALPSPP